MFIQVNLQRLKSLLRPPSSDTNSAEKRSLERYRRILLTLITSVGVKALSLLITFISVPLTIRYLGQEQYALWVTISSTVALFSFADLGIGNGLLNAITQAHGNNDRELAQKHISSAFFLLSIVACVLALLFALVYVHVPWAWVYNVSSPDAVAEAGPATAIFMACFLLSMPLGVVQRVQLGYQEGFVDNRWVGLGKIFSLIGVIVAIAARASLSLLVFALVGGPVLSLLLNSIFLFGIKRPWLRPRVDKIVKSSMQKVSQIGFLFFILQLAGAFAFSSNSLILAQILGPVAVAQYALAAQLFNIPLMIFGMVLSPLWPAYGEAVIKGDAEWIRKTFIRSVKIGLLINGLPSLFLLMFGSQVIHLWVGSGVVIPFLLLLGLAVWTLMYSINGPIAMLLNGANVIRFQVVCALLVTVSNVFLSIFLTHKIGVSGVVWGSIVPQIMLLLIPCLIFIPRLLSTLQQKHNDAIKEGFMDSPIGKDNALSSHGYNRLY